MAGKRKKKTRQGVATCKKATSVIAAYVSANLSVEMNHSFEEHLQACPDCLAFLKTYKKTVEMARSFLSEEGPPAARLKEIQSCVLGKATTR
jgi:anti-sigma factor RsiW